MACVGSTEWWWRWWLDCNSGDGGANQGMHQPVAHHHRRTENNPPATQQKPALSARLLSAFPLSTIHSGFISIFNHNSSISVSVWPVFFLFFYQIYHRSTATSHRNIALEIHKWIFNIVWAGVFGHTVHYDRSLVRTQIWSQLKSNFRIYFSANARSWTDFFFFFNWKISYENYHNDATRNTI